MNYKDIAKMIPAKYRREILETNMIAEAVGYAGNGPMEYLHAIWKNCVEPDIGNCGVCYQRVLENFRKMQQSMVDLALEEATLNQL